MKESIIKIFVVLLVIPTVFSGVILPVSEKGVENGKAPEHSQVITATEVGWDLERVDFIHYAKPTFPARPPKTTTCYSLMGLKWTILPVNYYVNPSNQDGMSYEFVLNTLSQSSETWDAATGKELFNEAHQDYSAKYGVQDFKNSVDFGDGLGQNVIAVTTIWFTRIGKRIVEFDIRFNEQYNWGNADENSALMDLQNIATHELGHGVGLNDVYSTSCLEVTMYGYGTEGEIKKRDLAQPDITGLQQLYGV